MIQSSPGGLVSSLNPVDIGDIPAHAPDILPPLPAKHRHQCPSCSKSFTTSGHLSRHSKLHSGVKEFTCPFHDCNKTCSRQDNLTQHYRVHLPRTDRKESCSYVRARLDRMRLATADAPRSPPHDVAEGSPSAVSFEETPLMDSVSPALDSLVPMPFMDSTRMPRHANITSRGALSSSQELSYAPAGTRGMEYASAKEDIASLREAPSATVEQSWPHTCATADNDPNYRVSFPRREWETPSTSSLDDIRISPEISALTPPSEPLSALELSGSLSIERPSWSSWTPDPSPGYLLGSVHRPLHDAGAPAIISGGNFETTGGMHTSGYQEYEGQSPQTWGNVPDTTDLVPPLFPEDMNMTMSYASSLPCTSSAVYLPQAVYHLSI